MRRFLLVVLMAALLPMAMNAAVIWSGEQVIDWNNGKFLQLEAAKFENMKAGDQLVVKFQFTGGTQWPQVSLAKGDWSGNLKGIANTAIAEGMTEVSYIMLTPALTELKAAGLIVTGIGFTLTAIETIEGDGGDYSHALWVGATTIGNWSGYQQLPATAFADATEGQLMRIKFKNLGAGAYLSLRNPVDGWPTLSDSEDTYIAGKYQQYTITAAMLAELQANGMVVSGVNFTVTSVELWNADEIKTLALSVPITDNWVFTDGAPSFTIHAENPYAEAVTANAFIEVFTDKQEPVCTVGKSVSVPANGSQDIVLTLEDTPQAGIYHATATVNDDLARGFYFAVNPTQIVSATDKQNDFDSYWAAAKQQLAAVPVEATMTEIPARSGSKRKVYLVEMQSIADGLSGDPVIIRGYYAEPTDGQKHPVLIHYQGYDSENRPGGDSATPWCFDTRWDTDEQAQYAEFVLSNRGQSVNNRPASGRDDGIDRDFTNIYGDWFAYQFGNKDAYYYRGAYMDCLRAIDFLASRPTSDMQNLFAEGQSQGGAFTVAAAALSDYKFKAIAPAITFMGDFPDYFQIASWPASVAFNCQKEIVAAGGTMSDADLYAFLSYYDTKNLATSITCPYITSVGLQDNVCPPHTNLAPYNNVQTAEADKQVVFNAELQHSTNGQWNTTFMDFFKKYTTDTTGISEISNQKSGMNNSETYNLAGQRVSDTQLPRGLFIRNGKKFIVK